MTEKRKHSHSSPRFSPKKAKQRNESGEPSERDRLVPALNHQDREELPSFTSSHGNIREQASSTREGGWETVDEGDYKDDGGIEQQADEPVDPFLDEARGQYNNYEVGAFEGNSRIFNPIQDEYLDQDSNEDVTMTPESGDTSEGSDDVNADDSCIWYLIGDNTSSPKVGSPAPEKLRIKLRHKQTNKPKTITFIGIDHSKIDWNRKEHVKKIGLWRRQVLRRNGFPLTKTNVKYAPDEDAYLILQQEKVRALLDRGHRIPIPNLIGLFKGFNEFFTGMRIKDKNGKLLPPRPKRDFNAFNSKVMRPNTEANNIRERVKEQFKAMPLGDSEVSAYVPVITKHELAAFRTSGHFFIDDLHDPEQNAAIEFGEKEDRRITYQSNKEVGIRSPRVPALGSQSNKARHFTDGKYTAPDGVEITTNLATSFSKDTASTHTCRPHKSSSKTSLYTPNHKTKYTIADAIQVDTAETVPQADASISNGSTSSKIIPEKIIRNRFIEPDILSTNYGASDAHMHDANKENMVQAPGTVTELGITYTAVDGSAIDVPAATSTTFIRSRRRIIRKSFRESSTSTSEGSSSSEKSLILACDKGMQRINDESPEL